MEFSELIKGLADKLGVDGLADENGEAGVSIDGMDVVLARDDAGETVLKGLLGDAPPEGGEAFANALLDANMLLMGGRPAAFVRDPQSKSYVLVERVATDGIDLDSFCTRLGVFVDALESWRRFLADFRPVAEALGERNAGMAAPADIARQGFITA